MKFVFEVESRIVETVVIGADNEKDAWDQLDNGYVGGDARNIGDPIRRLVQAGQRKVCKTEDQRP